MRLSMKDKAQQMKHPILYMLLVVAMENTEEAEVLHNLLADNADDAWLDPDARILNESFLWCWVDTATKGKYDCEYWSTEDNRLFDQLGDEPTIEDLEAAYNYTLTRFDNIKKSIK